MRPYWQIYTEDLVLIAQTNSRAQLTYFLLTDLTPHWGVPAYVVEYPIGDVLTVEEWLSRVP